MLSFKKYITEGLSPILYHRTFVNNARRIMKEDLFRMSENDDFEGKFFKRKNKDYFASFSRDGITSAYLRSASELVQFKIDGRKLSTRYAGRSVDYFYDPHDRTKKRAMDQIRKEREDRIISHKQDILNFSKYVISTDIHLYMPYFEGYSRKMTIEHIEDMYNNKSGYNLKLFAHYPPKDHKDLSMSRKVKINFNSGKLMDIEHFIKTYK